MKKTLIALSLAALSTAAVADVTLYGQIKAGVEVSKTKTKRAGVTTKNHTTTQIADFGSRIGFKGHEAIGNNLNAIWQVESKTSIAGTDSGWANRESFIGLEGNFGKFRAGNLNTQLDNMGQVDPWEYSNRALGLATFTRTAERVVSVRYDTPVFAGFSANVQFTPRDNQTKVRGAGNAASASANLTTGAVTSVAASNGDPTGRTNNLSDTAAYYAGLNYENAGFFAQYGLAYKNAASLSANGQKSLSALAQRVEAGYDANNLFVAAGYQYTNGWDSLNSYTAALHGDSSYNRATDRSTGIKTHELALTGAYRFGNVTPRLSYAHGFKPKAKSLSPEQRTALKYNQVILGADYDFSKRTTAFAQAGWLKVGGGQNKSDTVGGLVGLRHKF